MTGGGLTPLHEPLLLPHADNRITMAFFLWPTQRRHGHTQGRGRGWGWWFHGDWRGREFEEGAREGCGVRRAGEGIGISRTWLAPHSRKWRDMHAARRERAHLQMLTE